MTSKSNPHIGDVPEISRERAIVIARAVACERCKEYSWRSLRVTRSSPALHAALGEVWHAKRVCGVCGLHSDLGIDAEGDVLYPE